MEYIIFWIRDSLNFWCMHHDDCSYYQTKTSVNFLFKQDLDLGPLFDKKIIITHV